MIWTVAADLGVDYAAWVHLFQSRLFEDDFPKENAQFKNVTYVRSVDGKRGPSLAEMRRRMIGSFEYEAGVFIGGMEGVEDEFALFTKRHQKTPVLPFASTGGAALLLYDQTQGLPSSLMDSLDYVGIFHRLLDISASELRRMHPAMAVRRRRKSVEHRPLSRPGRPLNR